MKHAVAIGELLIDFVPQQKGCSLCDVTHFERVAGGAPANVALAVSRLGGKSSMISQVGEDAFGTHIIENLKNGGVNTRYVFRTNRANTGLAFVSLDMTGNREFSFYRNPSADLFLSPSQITQEMFEDAGVLHFCSVDLVDWPVKQAHKLAIEYAKQNGMIISFDPNVRLPLWESELACQSAIREFLPLADLVKLSHDEIAFVTGIADEIQAVQSLLNLGCSMVLVTKGEDGASVYTDHLTAHTKAAPTKVVDTTGAGDSFAGAFLYQLLKDKGTKQTLTQIERQDLQGYLDFSARCAAFTCAHRGAIMPSLNDLVPES